MALAVKVEIKYGARIIGAPLYVYGEISPQRVKKSRKSDNIFQKSLVLLPLPNKINQK